MRHLLHSETYDTAILLPSKAMRSEPIESTYFANGLDKDRCITFSVDYGGKKKPTKTIQKEYLAKLLPELDRLGIQHLFVCDGEYFKTLAKKTKAEPYYGSVNDCAIEGYEHMSVTLGMNHSALFYNPAAISKLKLSIDALNDYQQGKYEELGKNVLAYEAYPKYLNDIRLALESLHQYDALTCDIEAFSLKHHDAGIGTIAFAWDQHSGVAFNVDYKPLDFPEKKPTWCKKDKKLKQKLHYGEQVLNPEVRALLCKFFETYEGTIIWHNISYDAYVLVYQLWMDDLLDREGMLKGIEVMTRSFHCTKLITYLATNSCAGNKLSLKEQAHEYLGNYAQEEINDIRLIEQDNLLEYNLLDCAGTWFVLDKHWHTVVLDYQLDIYENLFQPCITDIIEMQLTGLCLDMKQVLVAEKFMAKERKKCIEMMLSKPKVQEFIYDKRLAEVEEYSTTRVKKRITIEETKFEFNANSNQQVQDLLYDYMAMPVIDKTDSKQPAVGGKTLEKLLNHTDKQDYKDIIQALYDYTKVDKILSSFIPAFKNAPKASDGMHYLYGSFNLGGTKSGRLSSSNVNLQQLPSTGSPYAKIIKKCFTSPPGWIFCGADSASLEDRISALTTKDSNKLAVYLQGFDGHILRAYNYFPEEYSDIQQSKGRRVFQISQDGITVDLFEGDEIVTPDGQTLKVEKYFDTYS